jgi:hypothetical protein
MLCKSICKARTSSISSAPSTSLRMCRRASSGVMPSPRAAPEASSQPILYHVLNSSPGVRISPRQKYRALLSRRPTRPSLMKYATDRPFANSEKAARKRLEIASTVEPIQDGRIHMRRCEVGSAGLEMVSREDPLSRIRTSHEVKEREGIRQLVRFNASITR